MKEWATKNFRFEKDLYFCFDCGKTFDLYFLTEYYGYLHLICNQCGKKAYVNCFEDHEFQRLENLYEQKYTDFRNLDRSDPQTKGFYKDFEDTCDPCECGGKFIMEAKDKCPHCSSTNVEEVRIKRDFEYVDMVSNWVTHEKMNKKDS